MAFFLSFFMSVALWAAPDTCSTVDLDQNIQGLGSVPSWSQGDSNLCYAYTAATMIDAYRFSRGDKDTQFFTSPFLLSVKTVETHKDRGSSFRGGRVEHAFATARTYGICSSRELADRLGPDSADRVIARLTQLHKKAKQSPDSKNKVAESVLRYLEHTGVDTTVLPARLEVEKNLHLSLEEFIGHTLSIFCKDPQKLDYLPIQKTLFQPRRNLEVITARMNLLLEAKTPVGINFCSTVVTEPQHKGHFENDKWTCRRNLNHSALISGRKMINGKCHYKIRDTACDNYNLKNPGYCENGSYWLESTQLANNLEGIYWLD